MSVTDAIRPRPSNALQQRDLGDELMFVEADGDTVHTIDRTALEIYKLCDGSRTVEQIVDGICDQYDVDRATADADVRRIVDRLTELRILERA